MSMIVGSLLVTSTAAARAQGSAAPAPVQQAAPGAKAPGGPSGSLELTPEQKVKLDAIAKKYAPEGKATAELFSTDPAEAMKRMIVLRTKMQKEVRTVLTIEQRAIYDRNVAEMNAQMDAHMP
jgi:Spy/CpxP family protein refolding chaperone